MSRLRAQTPSPAPRSRRLVSWGWDYLVILAWLGLLFLLIGLPQSLSWIDLSTMWESQLSADIAITLLTVVPYLLYLTLTERGPTHASWGKRRAGIAVVAGDGGPPGDSAVLIRNLVKVLPWQLGHMGTMRLINSTSPTLGTWLNAASLALLAMIVIPVLFRERGAHDLLAGTTVTWAHRNEPAARRGS